MSREHHIVLRDCQPWRIPALEAGELSPLDVMRANMEFFHYRAAEILASVMAMPLGENATQDQLAAFHDLAGMVKCRELSQACARDLARYTNAPMAAVSPPGGRLDAAAPGKAIERIPTPKAVSDAFAAAAKGWHLSLASVCEMRVWMWEREG